MNLYDEVLLIYEAHDKSVSEGVPNGILKVKKLSNSINWDALYNIKNNFRKHFIKQQMIIIDNMIVFCQKPENPCEHVLESVSFIVINKNLATRKHNFFLLIALIMLIKDLKRNVMKWHNQSFLGTWVLKLE